MWKDRRTEAKEGQNTAGSSSEWFFPINVFKRDCCSPRRRSVLSGERRPQCHTCQNVKVSLEKWKKYKRGCSVSMDWPDANKCCRSEDGAMCILEEEVLIPLANFLSWHILEFNVILLLDWKTHFFFLQWLISEKLIVFNSALWL